MQIHLIGQYPPPIGGITIHVKRLVAKLSKNKFDVKYFDDTDLPPMSLLGRIKNIFKKNPYKLNRVYRNPKNYNNINSIRLKSFKVYLLTLLFKEKNKLKIVHYHTKFWKYRALLSLASILTNNVKLVLTIHSMRDNIHEFNFLTKKYVKITLKFASHFIVTNHEIETKLIKWGTNKDKITVLHPYLKPEKLKADYDQIPESIWSFINSKEPIISANASKIQFFKNEDLYGLDLCIELCYRLKSKFSKMGFIFCLPLVGDIDYFETLKKRIHDYEINDNFLFVLERYEFYPFLENSDLFVRPTNTDGDALSIREALDMSIPTVSSDALERPAGTIIFKNRNIKDFEEKVLGALRDLDKLSAQTSNNSNDEAYDKIVEIYKHVSNIF